MSGPYALRILIWVSWWPSGSPDISDSIKCCHCHEPRDFAGQGESRRINLAIACSSAKPHHLNVRFVDQLLVVHRDGNTFRDAARSGGSLGDPRRLTWAGGGFSQSKP